LDGLPFEGLDVRKVDKDPAWELVAHRAYRTLCGLPADAPDVLAVFDHVNGQYTDQTSKHADYLQTLLRQNLQKWSRPRERSLQLLQTVAVSFAVLGSREEGKRFFAMNLPSVLPALRERGVDPNACLEDMEGLIARLPSVIP
jgi:hypothetical protein